MTVLTLIAGGVLLVLGAELLVRGASRMALAAGLTPLVVGLSVVAFGTSAPEFAVTLKSAYSGAVDVAVGNVVGSNIFNVLLILGISALITPLVVAVRLVRFDVPVMIVVSIIVLGMGLDGEIGRIDGLLLLSGLVYYTLRLFRSSQAEEGAAGADTDQEAGNEKVRLGPQIALVAMGLVLLVAGSSWFVGAAVDLARVFGVDELVIGLTIVAAGTSLPELTTSILASIRGERDIAVGNVIGSNIFNLLGVLGVAGILAPQGVPMSLGVMTFDIPFMIAVALATLPIFFAKQLLGRWEGAVFVLAYVGYVTWLVVDATNHSMRDELLFVVTRFAVPIVILTLTGSTIRALRQGRADRAAS